MPCAHPFFNSLLKTKIDRAAQAFFAAELQKVHVQIESMHCKSCTKTMTYDRWEAGKMCCDKPLFNDDHDD